MCRGRLPFFRSVSSIALEMACTCRVLAPVQIKKKSVNEATVLRSRSTRSVAFFSPAACAATNTASSGSMVDASCERGCLFALPPIKLPPVQFVLLNVVSHARLHESVNRFVVANPSSYFCRRDVVIHIVGDVDVTLVEIRRQIRSTVPFTKIDDA